MKNNYNFIIVFFRGIFFSEKALLEGFLYFCRKIIDNENIISNF